MRFLWLDDWYPEAYQAAGGRSATYSQLFDFCHGTSNYWDIAISQYADHFSDTLILNHEDDFFGKVDASGADVLCSQNVGRWPGTFLRSRYPDKKLVGFCSYRASMADLRGYDVVFSSFDWMPEACAEYGIRCERLRLAFGSPVLSRLPIPAERDIDVAFVGGLGFNIWDRGTIIMDHVARTVPGFRWWGYQTGRTTEALERTFQGPAWGPAYFNILLRSKLIINRHGEIAKGSQRQNMREYEASGCGAYLLSDTTKAWHGSTFYKDEQDLLALIPLLLQRWVTVERHAKESQQITLRQDCYSHRVPRFLEVVNSL